MALTATAIPEKIFFKIGEVCDLVGVEAHVLRYWETEFPQLSPQKNRSGQRAYRKRDVETALRIKELLYEELYTIAGAKKKLAAEMRDSTKPTLKVVSNNDLPRQEFPKQTLPAPAAQVTSDFDDESFDEDDSDFEFEISGERKSALHNLAVQLTELRDILKVSPEVASRRRW